MKYSIITINYNNRDGLRQTIESVINQTYTDFEYIIIDGGSTDGSVEVIKEYADKIDYWVSEPDNGIFNAMNKGILKSHGNYLNFMNSGDCFYDHDVLKNVKPHLNKDILQGSTYHNTKKRYYYCVPHADTMRYLYESSLNHQACFIKRELFQDTLYNENYKIVSDWQFFIQKLVFENCTFSNIPVIISLIEGSGISETAHAQNKQERCDVLQQYLPPRIFMDYEHFKGKESPVLDLIPQFNKTYRLHLFIYNIIKVILSIYNIIYNLKKKFAL